MMISGFNVQSNRYLFWIIKIFSMKQLSWNLCITRVLEEMQSGLFWDYGDRGLRFRSESGSNYHAGHRRNESMYAMTGLYAESATTGTDETTDPLQATGSRLTHDTVIRCHSRNPSSGLVDHRWVLRIHETIFPFFKSYLGMCTKGCWYNTIFMG